MTEDDDIQGADMSGAIEQRARRAAKKVGWSAKKSRWRANSIDNRGGFMLVEDRRSLCIAGSHFDLSAQDVIDFVANAEAD
jgi:hypothetical protein